MSDQFQPNDKSLNAVPSSGTNGFGGDRPDLRSLKANQGAEQNNIATSDKSQPTQTEKKPLNSANERPSLNDIKSKAPESQQQSQSSKQSSQGKDNQEQPQMQSRSFDLIQEAKNAGKNLADHVFAPLFTAIDDNANREASNKAPEQPAKAPESLPKVVAQEVKQTAIDVATLPPVKGILKSGETWQKEFVEAVVSPNSDKAAAHGVRATAAAAEFAYFALRAVDSLSDKGQSSPISPAGISSDSGDVPPLDSPPPNTPISTDKKVPNPNGAKGSPETQAQNEKIADELVDAGYEITGGGGKMKEKYFAGPDGKNLGSVRADISAAKSDDKINVQTVDTRGKNNSIPDKREMRNAGKLIKNDRDAGLFLIPKKPKE